MCDLLQKKCKRSFSEAWLSNDQYKSWIRKVASNDSLFHCIICNKNFSCNTSISRHADSTSHKNNIRKNTSALLNNNVTLKKNISKTLKFQHQWLEIEYFQPWLREASHDEKLCFCSFCNIYIIAKVSGIHRHANSVAHIKNAEKINRETKETDEDVNMMGESDLTRLSLDERKKAAEIRYAAFIAENNISYRNAAKILKFFQQIGKDSNVLQSMKMGTIKCKKVITKVLCPIETDRVVDIIQNTKFTIFIDETSGISNKNWMTFLVRYVHPETLDVCLQLVKLIDLDARNCSAEKLFNAFKCEMRRLQIPFLNIVALSRDNAPVITGKYLSFKKKLEEKCKNLLTFSCPCYSTALVAHTACGKIPDYCEEFVKKIANYINNSPKQSAIFEYFSEFFQETNRKILKLSDTRWLSRHKYIEKLLKVWDIVEIFLRELIMSEKTNSGKHLLSIMQKPDVKAYLLFLQHILNFFNLFNAFFQAEETRIQLLQPKSFQLLTEICNHFLKPELLQNLNNNYEFSKKENQKSLNEVYLGDECEKYINELITEGHVDIVATVQENCLQFYVTAAQEICKRLPINNKFLSKLKVFEPDTALRNTNRETFNDVSFVAQIIGGFDENDLKKEWFALQQAFTEAEKDKLSMLNFDEMWKQILQCTHQYPNLKSLLNAVRSLPNSNADLGRVFSLLPDVKTKKRNRLSSVSVNATCVLKSALKARRETAIDIEINEKHLSLMSADKLYSTCPKKQKSYVQLYAADEIASPSSSDVK